jgi:hypothetical protein
MTACSLVTDPVLKILSIYVRCRTDFQGGAREHSLSPIDSRSRPKTPILEICTVVSCIYRGGAVVLSGFGGFEGLLIKMLECLIHKLGARS